MESPHPNCPNSPDASSAGSLASPRGSHPNDSGSEPEKRHGSLASPRGSHPNCPDSSGNSGSFDKSDKAEASRKPDGADANTNHDTPCKLAEASCKPDSADAEAMARKLSPASLERIEKLTKSYPQKRSAALPILHLIQEEIGYLSAAAVAFVASKLELPTIHIHELISFYPMFRTQAKGKLHIKVCRTLSCALSGAYKSCEQIQKELNCPLGKTEASGTYTIDFVECIANCDSAPVVQVNDKLYENVTPDRVPAFIEELKALAEATPAPAAQSLPPSLKKPAAASDLPAFKG